MDEVSVACGCGRTMIHDSRRGKGAFRCSCGARIIINGTAAQPACLALTEDNEACLEPPCREAVLYGGVPLCGPHLDLYRVYVQVVREARAQQLEERNTYLREKVAEIHAARRQMAEEEAARQEAYKDQALVYYIRIGDLIKIGFTTNMRQRMSQLLPDEVLATEPGPAELERMRHRQFAHLRVRGERFRRGEDLISHVAMIRAHYGPPRMTGWLSAPSGSESDLTQVSEGATISP